jgi:hypothetical protein
MGRDSASDISNQMKPQPAALGFRVKSGCAPVVLPGPWRAEQKLAAVGALHALQ